MTPFGPGLGQLAGGEDAASTPPHTAAGDGTADVNGDRAGPLTVDGPSDLAGDDSVPGNDMDRLVAELETLIDLELDEADKCCTETWEIVVGHFDSQLSLVAESFLSQQQAMTAAFDASLSVVQDAVTNIAFDLERQVEFIIGETIIRIQAAGLIPPPQVHVNIDLQGGDNVQSVVVEADGGAAERVVEKETVRETTERETIEREVVRETTERDRLIERIVEERLTVEEIERVIKDGGLGITCRPASGGGTEEIAKILQDITQTVTQPVGSLSEVSDFVPGEIETPFSWWGAKKDAPWMRETMQWAQSNMVEIWQSESMSRAIELTPVLAFDPPSTEPIQEPREG